MAIRNCFYIKNTSSATLTLTIKGKWDYSSDQTNWVTPDAAPFSLDFEPDQTFYFKGTSTPSYEESYDRDWFGFQDLSGSASFAIGGSVQSLIWDGDGKNLMARKNVEDDEYYTFRGIFSAVASVTIDIADLVLNSKFKASDGHIVSYYFAEAFASNGGLERIFGEMLPAKTLAPYCYMNTFMGCNNLRVANPDLLPATVPIVGCYYQMFANCKKLTTPPKIHLRKLTAQDGCYAMFKGCQRLKEIFVDFTDWGESETTINWVDNVNYEGTFYAPHGLENIQDADHVPEYWDIVYIAIPVEPSKTLQLAGGFYTNFN